MTTQREMSHSLPMPAATKEASTRFPPIPPDRLRAADETALLSWYLKQKRELPWRRDRDPYRIWVSEVMLQQTTVAAVVPYYLGFMERFPTLAALAEAPVEDVLERWAGLGYYSRARNLHRSARVLAVQALAAGHFPRTTRELLEMPGFGPYTARAVASLAFDEKVGVLDGNVIRVLCRRFGLAVEWWKSKARDQLQELADRLAQVESPHDWNQAMMELGATVCTPARPACVLCPWIKSCVAHADGQQTALPLARPRRPREIWIWRATVSERNGRVALVRNDYAPFLKGQWIWPGRVERADKAPARFDYRASVTHHDIFVEMGSAVELPQPSKELTWVPRTDLAKWSPASLVGKAMLVLDKRRTGVDE